MAMDEVDVVDRRTGEFGLLLVQLGFHLAGSFERAVATLGLEPRQAGTLRRLAANEGTSQQDFAHALGVHPNRVVFLVDELEKLGLVERRRKPDDRRVNGLYLTDRGRQVLDTAADTTRDQNATIGHSLTASQRKTLTGLLTQLAEEQGLTPGALPRRPPGSQLFRSTSKGV
jgi:DNA-binding MarR family transcriptional regulator